MVPIDVFPDWLQPGVRALAEGGPTLWPVLQSLAWTLGLVAVFGPMAVRGHCVAAESAA
jgi:ABC-2 type transport system permease protein